MKKDIEIHAVKDVLIALVPEEITEDTIWRAVIINLKDSDIDTILINAEARGVVQGEEKHTATVRFFLPKLPAKSHKVVEAIMPETLALTNRFWLSFYVGSQIFERKFTFPANSVCIDRMIDLPLIGDVGVIAI
jgi:hypothetical protein